MEKLANHIALQSITEGGMEKRGATLLAAMLGPGIVGGAAGAALGSEDHKILSGILGAGPGFVAGFPSSILGGKAISKLYELGLKVKNPKVKAALEAIQVPLGYTGIIGGGLAGSAGAGYGTGKLVDWLDKLG